jgi:hypothetical protein
VLTQGFGLSMVELVTELGGLGIDSRQAFVGKVARDPVQEQERVALHQRMRPALDQGQAAQTVLGQERLVAST